MLKAIIELRLDWAAFALLSVAAMAVVHRRVLARHPEAVVGSAPWTAVAVIVVGAGIAARQAELTETAKLRFAISGFAPTYARLLETEGHFGVATGAPPEDPHFLRLIERQKLWLSANPAVADVYTMRRDADGAVRLVVDSETDYDRDGAYSEDREARTENGEVFPAEDVSEEMHGAFDGASTFQEEIVADRWGVWVSAFEPLRGPDGAVEAIVGVDYPAESWLRGIARARFGVFGLLSGLVVAVILGAAHLAPMRAEIARRRRAEEQMRESRERTIVAARQAERLNERLVEASRRAGMAEVAIGVLHNVGNALNGVNVSADGISARLRGLRADALRRAADLLTEHRTELARFLSEDEKGRRLPEYFARFADAFAAERAALLDELDALRSGLAHAKEIVAAQQALAKGGSNVLVPVPAAEVAADALRMRRAAFERAGVAVELACEETPPSMVDRHKVLQILVNLLANAERATAALPPGARRAALRATRTAGKDDERLRFVVEDNGEGIAPDRIPQLFRFGFTTRAEGHGFGLHAAANAAREMGGSLTAASDGPGRGATFVLEIPFLPVMEPASCA